MQINSTTPATKPQPVVVAGAVIAGATTVISGLVVILKDNPTAILWLGIVGVVVSGLAVVKDQIVKGMVVPLDDVAAYANDDRELVTGPASPGRDGQIVTSIGTEDTSPEALQAKYGVRDDYNDGSQPLVRRQDGDPVI